MSTASLAAVQAPRRPAARPARDRALDEALERMRSLVGAVLAVRDEHRAVIRRRGPLRRRSVECHACATAYPCQTRRLLRSSGVAGTA